MMGAAPVAMLLRVGVRVVIQVGVELFFPLKDKDKVKDKG